MRYAVHQVLIELASEALVVGRTRRSACRLVGVEHGSLAVDDLVDQFLGLVDTVGNLGGVYGLSVEARGLHALVRRDDNSVAARDFFGGQYVLCAARAVGLYLDGDAHLFACLGKSLRCHIGVGDTCGTSRYREYPVAAALRGSRFLYLIGELRGFLIVDDLQELFGRLCRLQFCGEVLVHQHLHQSCENLEVNIAVSGRRNHENQLAGRSVGRLIVHAAGNGDGGKGGSLDSFAFGVGDSDLHADSGGSHSLTGEDAVLVG